MNQQMKNPPKVKPCREVWGCGRLVGRQADRSAADGRLPRLPDTAPPGASGKAGFFGCVFGCSSVLGGLGVSPRLAAAGVVVLL